MDAARTPDAGPPQEELPDRGRFLTPRLYPDVSTRTAADTEAM